MQERNGSRHSFTAPRNCYRTRDGKYVAIAGASQSTFERMCDALEMPEIPKDPRFASNSLRMRTTRSWIAARRRGAAFTLEGTAAQLRGVRSGGRPGQQHRADVRGRPLRGTGEHRAVDDDELDGRPVPERGRQVVRDARRGAACRPAARIEHNREILVDELGFTEDELRG